MTVTYSYSVDEITLNTYKSVNSSYVGKYE